jgi:hypothetical protein
VLGYEVEMTEDLRDSVRVDGKRFDFVVDATWGHYRRPPIDLFYEPTLLIYYETHEPFPAVTMVDGPLCSVYPTEDSSIFTLSSVPHTPVGRFRTAGEAWSALAAVDGAMVAAKRIQMEAQIARYIPAFADLFKFLGPQLSMKTKPIGANDDRSCHVFQEGRMFTVMSGKIDTIFFAVERILSSIEARSDAEPSRDGNGLRDEILVKAGTWAPA